ncbi:endolytic transglycosylase MltG [Undibacterium jejuense]|uniref:Endolytic murein transglycosylase n=1 Tax=Undibacterium jejuense TaxID=1344949 RepID=A0A923HDW6_9BURK|nr:endolytic transglycosylase MltG [Undibacterium jejuense]MBC3862246.1 endolytic transglycosylase MltG [Undibacterium jejuense]
MSLIKNLFILLVLLLAAMVGGLIYWSGQALDTDGKTVEFTIKAGSGVRSASRQIQEAGVPVPAIFFELLARASGKASKLKAGSYELDPGETPLQLLDKIVNGEFSQGAVAVIEGWTFAQMRKAIDASPDLKHDTKSWSDRDLMKKLNADYALPEGLFFPDTYLFAKGTSDLQVYQQAYAAQSKRLDDAWEARSAGLPYKNKYEALIMASIIEKETGQKSERSMISAVFANRLKSGMLLQTDPTVIYGMGERYQGKIYKKDLLTDTPYNTYTRAGLPPTPIALPGLASLTAALNPAQSEALYFVARGDGTSVFSDNLSEHNRAVNKYQR